MFAKHLTAIWLAIAIVSGAVSFAIYQGQNNRERANNAQHTFICYFQDAVLKAPQPPERRKKALKFFNGLNAKLREPLCPVK